MTLLDAIGVKSYNIDGKIGAELTHTEVYGRNCVADNDAVIILETGHEKLRYLVGSAIVITSQDYAHLDITHFASTKAAEMLGNPDWQTQCEY